MFFYFYGLYEASLKLDCRVKWRVLFWLEDEKFSPLELQQIRRWITCIALVDFDLTLGQTMRMSYPPGSLSSKVCTRNAVISPVWETESRFPIDTVSSIFVAIGYVCMSIAHPYMDRSVKCCESYPTDALFSSMLYTESCLLRGGTFFSIDVPIISRLCRIVNLGRLTKLMMWREFLHVSIASRVHKFLFIFSAQRHKVHFFNLCFTSVQWSQNIL